MINKTPIIKMTYYFYINNDSEKFSQLNLIAELDWNILNFNKVKFED